MSKLTYDHSPTARRKIMLNLTILELNKLGFILINAIYYFALIAQMYISKILQPFLKVNSQT